MNGTEKQMNDLIQKLQRAIEVKLNWEDGFSWSHHQFEELSNRIESQTGILLSTNTLKRFFGRIQSKSLPSKTTLNTLAQFAGSNSFYDFAEVTQNQTNVDKNKGKSKKIRKLPRIMLYYLLTAIILIPLVIWSISKVKNIQLSRTSEFSQVFDNGEVPFTQIFKYNVNPKIIDSIDFNEYYKGAIRLSTRDSIFSWMHFIPGFRKVRFSAKKQVLWENSYMVKTDDWLMIFPWGGLEPRKYIPLNATNGYLAVTDSALEHNNINLEAEGGWANYFNAQYFGARGSDFTLETSFRNELKTGVQQCQDVIITIECQTFNFIIHFTQTGCQKFAELTLGNEAYSGIKNDLTKLALDMNSWQHIRLESNNGTFAIYKEDELLLRKDYSGTPGKITMLQYSFRGTGAIKNIILSDGDGNRVYSDDFDN